MGLSVSRVGLSSTAPPGPGALQGETFARLGARAFQRSPRLPRETRTQSLKGGREASCEAVGTEQVGWGEGGRVSAQDTED